MRRVLGLESLRPPLERSTVTVGKFFSVHRGHQALLQATVEAARRQQARAVVLTFDRHPLEILRPGTDLRIISSLDERLELIQAQGIDLTVIAYVNARFLALEPEAFVREVLVGRLGAVDVLASDHFRFGRNAAGDVALLRSLGERLGFRWTPVPPVLEAGERISSSRVGACVEAGRVAAAARLLGRPYSLRGSVSRGQELGRRLGFPTANVTVDPRRLLPADGVYVVRCGDGARSPSGALTPSRPGVANLGVRPTVDGTRRVLEVHLLDWEGDLYGREVCVQFLEQLRPEQRFPDLAALQAQIGRDVDAARAYHAGAGPQA